jgi:hypothetical protein
VKGLLISVAFALSMGANYYQWQVMREDTVRIEALNDIAVRAIHLATQRKAEADRCLRRTMEASYGTHTADARLPDTARQEPEV